jgi:hypothetical protein
MKRFQLITLLVAILVAPLIIAGSVHAGDLDDGISKYTDDSIGKDDELGDPEKNINFIKMDAKSKAKVRAKKGEGADDQESVSNVPGIGAMNSVILGAGGTIKGDIIIIDESKGDKTQVVE